MKKSKILVVILACILLISSLTACTSKTDSGETSVENVKSQDEITLKVAHIFAPTHPAQLGLEKFAEIVSNETDGKVKVDIYNSGVLGGDTEGLQQVIAGSLDAAIIMGISIWQGMDGRAGVEELPFLFTDSDMAHSALDGDFGDLLAKDVLEPTGVKVLSYWENGFRHFTNNKRAIVEPEDMNGIKFRIAESPIRVDTFNTLNASATPMAFPEVFTGLQQGTIDGQENPLSVIESSRFNEVQKYLSLSGHIYNAGVFIINPKVWESYPEDVKAAIEKAAAEARDFERELIGEGDLEIADKLEKSGMIVNEINKDAFLQAVNPVWERFTEKYGNELLDAALKYKK